MTDTRDYSKNYAGEDQNLKTTKLEAEEVETDEIDAETIDAETVDAESFEVDGVEVKMPVLSGEATTTWGNAIEAITVTGALITDLVFVSLKDSWTGVVTILTAKITATNTVTVTFSADPQADTIIAYVILR